LIYGLSYYYPRHHPQSFEERKELFVRKFRLTRSFVIFIALLSFVTCGTPAATNDAAVERSRSATMLAEASPEST
jgi:hypothetical protein